MKGSSDMPIPRPKIPTSLSIVSYIFFAVGLFGAMDGFIGMAVAKTDLSLSHLLTLILGIVYLFLSRGLRQCSCGWHIVALATIFVLLFSTIYGTAYYFLHYPFLGMSAYIFLIGRSIAFVAEIWILRVLTCREVRFLFYGNPNHNKDTLENHAEK
jgi:hypothetical protein